MIAVIDYGAGNPVSVKKALDWLGRDAAIVSDPEQIAAAAKIVLPGVGHFASTLTLGRTGMRDAIVDAIGRGVPFLGICVGMQWMFENSEESPETPGLALFPAQCQRFPRNVKSPHVGWNRIEISESSRLFRDLPVAPFFYFTHSFRAPVVTETTACCDYGGRFSAAAERGRLFGVQFHPEKSGEAGLKLLSNFCSL
jgi:imidazole glycerol-phosphate synthase subunit HisH